MPSAAARVLFVDSVDYAGTFPPASLALAHVQRNYAAYLGGKHRWLLGRLVVPVSELPTLTPAGAGDAWPLAVLLGGDVESGIAEVDAFARASSSFAIASIEARAANADAIPTLSRPLVEAAARLGAAAYLEIPLGGTLAPALAEIARHGLRAKVRTGGVDPEAIPSPDALLAFLEACVAAERPFKLTAGLHHAIRGRHPLTYEHGSAGAVMHGFLNVFMSVALLVARAPASRVEAVLDEQDAETFSFGDERVAWRGLGAGLDDLARARRLLTSFGSCSFEEPVAALEMLGLA